jgi:hypothetical protein
MQAKLRLKAAWGILEPLLASGQKFISGPYQGGSKELPGQPDDLP